MANQSERRQFQRVLFDSTAFLVSNAGVIGQVHKGRLHNLSLKGALFEPEDDWRAKAGECFELRLELNDDVTIFMDVTVMHVEGVKMGLRCDEIDLDSVTALRRLLSLNSPDQQEIEHEVSQLNKLGR